MNRLCEYWPWGNARKAREEKGRLETEFPITQTPLPLYSLEDENLLEKCYSLNVPDRDERIREGKKSRFRHVRSPHQRFLESLIPLADALDRLCSEDMEKQAQGNEILMNWLNAIRALQKRLSNLLEKEGLIVVNSLGKPVDLDIHEVIEVKGQGEPGSEVVVQEVQKGYTYDNRVVRDARVVVERRSDRESPLKGKADGKAQEE